MSSEHAYPKSGLTSQVRAEWIKLRTLRSTWITVAIVVVAAIGLAVLFSFIAADQWTHGQLKDRINFDPIRISQAGSFIAEIAFGVIGALVMTSEYSTGAIKTTLAGCPRRTPVAMAKALVLGVFVLAISEVLAFASFFVSRSVLLANGGREVTGKLNPVALVTQAHVPVVSLSTPGVPMALVRTGLFLALIAVAGLALGMLLRSTAGAISLYVALLLVIPIIVSLLPASISGHINPYLPGSLGNAMETASGNTSNYDGVLLTAWTATGYLVAYVVGLLVIGTALFVKRDA